MSPSQSRTTLNYTTSLNEYPGFDEDAAELAGDDGDDDGDGLADDESGSSTEEGGQHPQGQGAEVLAAYSAAAGSRGSPWRPRTPWGPAAGVESRAWDGCQVVC